MFATCHTRRVKNTHFYRSVGWLDCKLMTSWRATRSLWMKIDSDWHSTLFNSSRPATWTPFWITHLQMMAFYLALSIMGLSPDTQNCGLHKHRVSESLTRGGRENAAGIPGACATQFVRLWQEVHGLTLFSLSPPEAITVMGIIETYISQ